MFLFQNYLFYILSGFNFIKNKACKEDKGQAKTRKKTYCTCKVCSNKMDFTWVLSCRPCDNALNCKFWKGLNPCKYCKGESLRDKKLSSLSRPCNEHCRKNYSGECPDGRDCASSAFGHSSSNYCKKFYEQFMGKHRFFLPRFVRKVE